MNISQEITAGSNAKRGFFRKWAPLLVISLGLAIIIIDTTLLNVSFSYLIRDLNTDIQSLQWVITAYALTLAALTITGGRLGDLYGRKKMFILGAIIFAIGSFTASESHTVSTMIIGESIIEGIGAALMLPATMSLLVSTYKGRDRAIGMGVWGGIAAASSAIGPILGGFLTTNYSWRWGFRINVFVAAVLVIGSIILKECRDNEEKPKLDYFGIVSSSLGLLALVFGIIESSKYGWWEAKEVFVAFGHSFDFHGISIVPLSLAAGILILISFVIYEIGINGTDKTPLVSIKLFKNRQYGSSVLTTMVMATGQAGIIFSLPVFLQSVRGLDAYHTGLAFLPMSLTALVMAPFSAAVLRKFFAPKYLIQAGLFLSVVAAFYVRFSMSPGATAADFVPGLIIYGAGFGLMMAQISNMSMSAVSVEEAGEASGVNNTLRQIGTSLGTAIIGAALLTALATNLNSGIYNSNVIPTTAKPFIADQVAAQTSNVEFGGGAKIPGGESSIIGQEIVKISHQATADSNRLALLYTALITALGFAISFALPSTKDIEKEQSIATK